MTYHLLRKPFQQARRENALFRGQKIPIKESREAKCQFSFKRCQAGIVDVLNDELFPHEQNTSDYLRPKLRQITPSFVYLSKTVRHEGVRMNSFEKSA